MIEPEHVHAVGRLLTWLRTHGPADRHDVPPEHEPALDLCLADVPASALACVTEHGPHPDRPMPPTVVKLARDLRPGDVLKEHRAPVTWVRVTEGGVEVRNGQLPASLYRRTGGREPEVDVYTGPLPVPAEPQTLVTLTPAGELWLRQIKAKQRMTATAPTPVPINHPPEQRVVEVTPPEWPGVTSSASAGRNSR